jgi:glycosyltransferase involved in cell wall biosynthesis
VSTRERPALATIGGFTRPRDNIAHGTHHASHLACAAIAEVGGYSGIDAYHENARATARSAELAFPPSPPIRLFNQAELPTTRTRYSAIYVANGEQIGPVPFVLRPNDDWVPLVLSIGTAHAAPQWQSLFLALASGSVRGTDGFIFKSKAAHNIFRHVWEDWCARFGFSPGFPHDSVVVPNGVDTATLQRSASLRDQTRRLLRLAAEDVVFLAFSRLSPGTKGDQLALITRWKDVVQQAPRALLLLSGSQVDRTFVMELRLWARQAGVANRVLIVENPFELLGNARNALMSAADAFVHVTTGLEETSSLVVHEAMAHSLPVIASNWAGLAEVVTTAETGFLVPTLATAAPPGLNAALFGTTDLPVVLAASRTVHCHYDELVHAAVALVDPERRQAMGAAARQACEGRSLQSIGRAHVAYFDHVSGEAKRAWGARTEGDFRPLVDLDRILATQASSRLHPEQRVRLVRPANAALLTAGWTAESLGEIRSVLRSFEHAREVDLITVANAICAEGTPQVRAKDTFGAASRLIVRLLNHGVIELVQHG